FTQAAARRITPRGEASRSGCFRSQLLCLFDRFLDVADHVEGSFRKVIVFAGNQALEALDGVGKVNQLARRAGEDLSHEERLRQEALDLAGAGDGQLVALVQ